LLAYIKLFVQTMNREEILYSRAELQTYLEDRGYYPDQVKQILSQSTQHSFKIVVPRYYADLINWLDPDDPLMKMVVPMAAEQDVQPHELTDPIGDHSHSPVPGIVHRYPDRCLLMLTNACAVHCRFCFRKNMLNSNTADLAASMQYLQSHPEIWEVIFSGGDPFVLSGQFFETILKNLGELSHLQVIRFHTRTPAVYPALVTADFVKKLTNHSKVVVIVIHINHPREVTQAFVEAVQLLRQAGCMVLSQTVLMRDINNSAHTLAELFKLLVVAGIKPYYLHHLDLAAGTHHFRVSVAEGKEIMQQLRGNISGICLPEYVIDTPGGNGKIPVFWFKQTEEKEYIATSFEGKHIKYTDFS